MTISRLNKGHGTESAIKMLHSGVLEKSKERYERVLAVPNDSRQKLEICKKENPSTNSLDQRQPLTTKQCVSSAMVEDVIGKSSRKLEA